MEYKTKPVNGCRKYTKHKWHSIHKDQQFCNFFLINMPIKLISVFVLHNYLLSKISNDFQCIRINIALHYRLFLFIESIALSNTIRSEIGNFISAATFSSVTIKYFGLFSSHSEQIMDRANDIFVTYKLKCNCSNRPLTVEIVCKFGDPVPHRLCPICDRKMQLIALF